MATDNTRGEPGELIETIEIDGRVYQIRRGPAEGVHRTEVYWRIGHRHNGKMQWHLDLHSDHRPRPAMHIAELEDILAGIRAADVETAKQVLDEQGRP